MNLFIAIFLAFGSVSFVVDDSINITLRNNSIQSIKLNIPGIMNPNLSPFSNSNVSFDEGQEVYFFEKKKRYLLFKATQEMDSTIIIVDELIKKRKMDLNL